MRCFVDLLLRTGAILVLQRVAHAESSTRKSQVTLCPAPDELRSMIAMWSNVEAMTEGISKAVLIYGFKPAAGMQFSLVRSASYRNANSAIA